MRPSNYNGPADITAEWDRMARMQEAEIAKLAGVGSLVHLARKGGYEGRSWAQPPVKDTFAEQIAGAGKAVLQQRIKAGEIFHLLGRDDLLRQPLRKALVKRFLYEGMLAIVAGPYSRFKSFIVLDMAAHLALGLDWAGNKVPEPVDVLYVAAEGESGVRIRIDAWAQHHGQPWPYRLRVLGETAHLSNDIKKLHATLHAYAEHGFRPAVVIIDTLAAATAGVNENTSDMGVPIENARALGRAFGCAVVLVDHTGHEGQDRARGWSGKGAAADAVYMISSPDREGYTATIAYEKPPKDGPRPEPLGFRGTEITLGHDEDGDVITSLAFKHDAAIKPAAATAKDRGGRKKGRADPNETLLWRNLFFEIIQDLPMKTSGVAQEMAEKTPVSAEDDTAGYRASLVGPYKKWLENIAAGGNTLVPDVAACECTMPDGKTRGWRRVEPQPQSEDA